MKKLSYLLCTALVMMFAACSNDDVVEEQQGTNNVNQAETITITVGMPGGNNTRVDYVDENLSFTWESGDALALIGYSESNAYLGNSELKLIEGDGTNSGVFQGRTIADATKYKIYYKAKNLVFDYKKGGAGMSYDNQVQTAANSTKHVKDCLYLKAQRSVEDPTKEISLADLKDGNFVMKMHNGIFRVDIKTLAEELKDFNTVTWRL